MKRDPRLNPRRGDLLLKVDRYYFVKHLAQSVVHIATTPEGRFNLDRMSLDQWRGVMDTASVLHVAEGCE